MAKKALIIVDMLKDFLEPDGKLFCGEEARKIIPFVKEKLEAFRKDGLPIVFVMDNHAPDDAEFKMFPPHCVAGTEGAQVIDELAPAPGEHLVKKTRYSGFYNTDLDGLLKREGVVEAHVVGVCTSICVMFTVADLRNRDYEVVVYRGGVADFDPDAHRFALKHMEKILGARVE